MSSKQSKMKNKDEIKFVEKETNICTGFSCNNKCLFCCEGHNRDAGDKSTKQVMTDILSAKRRGITRIIFTGGESTIRKDIFSLIRLAKKQEFREIFLITNGRMCSRMEFCEKLKGAGLTHILFSLNGSKSEIHDKLTQVPGSFSQVVEGIKNIKKAGSILIENNTTINKINFKDLPQIAELLIKLGVDYYEFIFVNPSGLALENFDSIVPRYKEVVLALHKALDVGINADIKATAESMPFCMMKGYEKYMTEFYMAPVREKLMPQQNIYDLNESRKKSVKIKGSQCRDCRYFSVCEGIWKEYAKRFGFEELTPIPGKRISSMREIMDELK